LEDDGLLSFEAKRIDRIDQIDAELARGCARKGQAGIEVAAHEQRPRTVRQSLRELSHRDFSGGNEYERRNARSRSVASERCGSVARGCAGNRAGPQSSRLRDGHSHPAILERPGGIESFVLYAECGATRPP